MDDCRQTRDESISKLEDSNRRLAEESGKELYHRIFDTAADGLLLVDQHGVICEANRAACEIHGYSANELNGLAVIELIHPKDRHLCRAVTERIVAGDIAQVRAVNLHKDGSAIPVELRVSLFEFLDRKLALCVIHDLTERSKAEEAIDKEQRHLRRLLEMHEHDRQLVAYEIHDGFIQSLVGARMLLDMPSRHIHPHMRDRFEKAVHLIERSVEEARRLISGQRPLILDEHGLRAAIEHLVCERQKSDGPEILYEEQVSFGRLVPPLETAVFRVVQEGLNNAERHSRSPRIQLRMTQTDGHLQVEVRDWGVGFNPAGVGPSCFGLEGLRQRARLFGGTAQIDSVVGSGTTVTVEFPLVTGVAQECPEDEILPDGS